ncbi:MAG: carboxypeptidase regulatory-like domain-containing protein [Verrucomicrobia bacterium]|nr:carboxypeptidase regulatory-like domain-containing protein [Verrucomicrobiota bacterium]
MKRTYSWALSSALACALSFSTFGGATIIGKVNLPPAKSKRPVNARYQLARAQTPDSPSPPLAVVYLTGVFPEISQDEAAKTVEMGQKNLQFEPGLVVVQMGSSIAFPNFDDEYHNVLSYSKAKVLDLGRYRKNEKAPSVVFDKAGVVELSCEIHEHMQATILVLETPHFTLSDSEGNFRLDQLPAGNYTVNAWLNRRTMWEKPVSLKEGETVEVILDGGH